MLGALLKHETKNLLRERMTLLMLLYPLLIGIVGRILLDRGVISGEGVGIAAMLFTLFGGFAYGAMAGFSLLDDRDDQVLDSIRISPVSVHWYIWFKISFVLSWPSLPASSLSGSVCPGHRQRNTLLWPFSPPSGCPSAFFINALPKTRWKAL